jgi:hypothetical protein
MTPSVVSKTGTGASAWIPVDYRQQVMNLGLGIVATGTITYDIEHTYDNVMDSTVTPTAFKHPTITGQTASKDGTYSSPIRAVRLNVTAGTGTATLTVLQGSK